MDFLELAKKRYSVRKYEPTQVEPEKLEAVLRAAHVAPTAANRQPVRLLVVQSDEGLEKISKASDLHGAPMAIIVCSDHERAWERATDGMLTTHIDASILTDHMMLEATSLGLASLWVCKFDAAILQSEFSMPESFEPVNILCLGYAACEPKSPDRHNDLRIPLEALVSYEVFSQ